MAQYNSMNKSHHHILLSIKNSKKILNAQSSKYSAVKEAAILCNFQTGIDFFTFLWTDHALSVKEIRELPSHIKVNHFPEITTLTRKNKLANALNTMQRYFPKEYDFFPETFILPMDHAMLLKKHNKGKFYIVKPENGCQGKGIFLLSNPAKLEKSNQMIVQRYISNPLLIDGLKFDLRLYVLVTCVQPLRVFLYQDGLARFSTHKFETPHENNLSDLYQHLTNYAINKNHQNFKVDEENFSTGHKRLLSTLFTEEILNAMLTKISDLIIKALISVLPGLQNAFNLAKKDNPNACYQLLGFDVLMTDNMKFKLIEVNQNPSLMTDTGVDREIKNNMIRNIFQMIEVPLGQSEERIEVRVKAKDKHEMNKKGKFSRIYPCEQLEETQKYDPLIAKSRELYRQKFGINVIRPVSRIQSPSKNVIRTPQWNQSSQLQSDRLERVYGGRTAKSSHRKRQIFL